MASFTRGQGDGEEQIGPGGAGQPPVIRNPPGQVDMDSSAAKDIVQSLVGMGISETDAELAVRQTGADSAEAAIAWVFENRDRDEMLDAAGGSMYQEYKMVFVINASLPMTPGKMAAQVGHAAIALYQDLISKQDQYGGPVLQWNENGAKKIVLRAENLAQLVDIASKAERAGLPYQHIEDAGLTQIPAGSQTVLAIFGVVSDVDKVTGHLKIF